jgi:hypothetical protein
MKSTRVLVANSPRLMPELVVETISDQSDIEVVGDISEESGIESAVAKTQPDFLIVALNRGDRLSDSCQAVLQHHPKVGSSGSRRIATALFFIGLLCVSNPTRLRRPKPACSTHYGEFLNLLPDFNDSVEKKQTAHPSLRSGECAYHQVLIFTLAVVLCGVAVARNQRSATAVSSELGQENMSLVAASAADIKAVLVKTARLMVELKAWVSTPNERRDDSPRPGWLGNVDIG